MAKALRAELKLETKKAERDVKRTEASLKKFGDTTDAVKGKTQQMGGEVNKGAQAVDKSSAAWEGWGVKAAGAVASLMTGLMAAAKKLEELEIQRRKVFQGMADEATSPEAREFQRIMGMSATQAQRFKYQKAAQFNIDRGQVQDFSGMLRSGISAEDVGGRGKLEQIESFGMQVMQATGTSGSGVAGLMIQAKESGSAKTPEDYRKFLGTSATMARESKVKLEEFAMIMTRTLVKARAAGIPADRWQAIAAAVTFRSPNAEQAATTLEQMLIAAGKGENVPAAIQKKGTEAIMKYQAAEVGRVLKDEGVVAANLYGKEIGMEGEAGQRVAAAFDVAAQAKVDALQARIAGPGGGFTGAVLQPIAEQAKDKFYQDARARRNEESARFQRENAAGNFNARVAEAEEAQQARLAQGDTAERLAEASDAINPISSSRRNVRQEVYEQMKRELEGLATDKFVSEGTRKRATAMLGKFGWGSVLQSVWVPTGAGGEDTRNQAANLLEEANRERMRIGEERTSDPNSPYAPKPAAAQPSTDTAPGAGREAVSVNATNVYFNSPQDAANLGSKAQAAGVA